MTDDDTRDMAVQALTKIDLHMRECKTRWGVVISFMGAVFMAMLTVILKQFGAL